jgi:hypothetical protein
VSGRIKKVARDPFYTIYALIDPRDFTPFYVGCTRFPKRRYTNHLAPRRWEIFGGAYESKMKMIQAAGLRPYFGVLETTTDATREIWHIREITRLGFTLVNRRVTGRKSVTATEPLRHVLDCLK